MRITKWQFALSAQKCEQILTVDPLEINLMHFFDYV
jgi:hypothetical protein